MKTLALLSSGNGSFPKYPKIRDPNIPLYISLKAPQIRARDGMALACKAIDNVRANGVVVTEDEGCGSSLLAMAGATQESE